MAVQTFRYFFPAGVLQGPDRVFSSWTPDRAFTEREGRQIEHQRNHREHESENGSDGKIEPEHLGRAVKEERHESDYRGIMACI